MEFHTDMVATESISDASLVARCRAGDDEAWEELVRRFSRYVLAIAQQAYRLSPTDAEDVFQDVFARTYERLGDLRNDDAVRPWIAQLTRRVCLDRIAASGNEQPLDDITDERLERTTEELDDAFTIREALADLGEPCHELLDRFFARDESYRTISEQLDLPSGTIASRISRCLGKLRSELEGRNPAEGASGGKR